LLCDESVATAQQIRNTMAQTDNSACISWPGAQAVVVEQAEAQVARAGLADPSWLDRFLVLVC